MKPVFRLIDFFIILLAAGLIVFLGYEAYMSPKSDRVMIQGPHGKWTFPVDAADETVVVHGPLGETVVKIGGGHAWVESSPCQNQTCVATGGVRKHGHWAACLPNNVFLLVQGIKRENEVDVVTW
jgi:hypothetical protein